MWTQLVWRTDLPIGDCEPCLANMPKRTLLLSRATEPFVVARASGRMFYLFVAGSAGQILFAPYFQGFLLDKHGGGTEIRGRLFPAAPTVAALFLGGISLVTLLAMMATDVFTAVWIVPAGTGAIAAGLFAAGWRIGTRQSALIAASIEKAFEAHRLIDGKVVRSARQ